VDDVEHGPTPDIRALGAEIAGHDASSVHPPPAARRAPPRWLIRLRFVGLVAFVAQAIYGGVQHDGRVLVGGLIGSILWFVLLMR